MSLGLTVRQYEAFQERKRRSIAYALNCARSASGGEKPEVLHMMNFRMITQKRGDPLGVARGFVHT